MPEKNENLSSALGTDIGKTDIGFKMPTTAKEAFEKQAELVPKVAAAQADVERQKMNLETGQLEAKGQAAQESADKTKAKIQEIRDKEALLPRSEFHPTKENAESLGGLFSMVATLGLMMGNSGKLASQNALGAMTGMLKGWQEGRQDLYEKELKEFEKNYQKIKDMREDLRKDLEDFYKVAPLDREAGQAKLEVIQRKFGTNSVAGSYAALGNVSGLQDIFESAGNLLQKAEELRIRKLDSQRNARDSYQYVEKDGKVYAINKNNPNDIREVDPRIAGAVGLGKEKPQPTKSVEQYFPGLVFDPKNKKETQDKKDAINNGALSLATAQDLIDYAKEHPDALGRRGQVNQNVERYIKSLREGTDLPTDGQPNLVFAKRYAAYLVGYERALAGGNKSMTVAFQKRFNDLMSQNQFNAGGFEQLMKQQMQEIAEGVSSRDPAITGRGLVELGQDIKKRGTLLFDQEPKTPTLQEFLSKAREANPNSSDEDLTNYYNKKYVGK